MFVFSTYQIAYYNMNNNWYSNELIIVYSHHKTLGLFECGLSRVPIFHATALIDI